MAGGSSTVVGLIWQSDGHHFPKRFALPIDDVHAWIMWLLYVALDDTWTEAAQGKLWTLRLETQTPETCWRVVAPRVCCSSQWQCMLCDAALPTKRDLAVHSRHVHG